MGWRNFLGWRNNMAYRNFFCRRNDMGLSLTAIPDSPYFEEVKSNRKNDMGLSLTEIPGSPYYEKAKSNQKNDMSVSLTAIPGSPYYEEAKSNQKRLILDKLRQEEERKIQHCVDFWTKCEQEYEARQKTIDLFKDSSYIIKNKI
jgi:CRISPR/Cas system endoribonuclease Cas6 (RAMP superfamily)